MTRTLMTMLVVASVAGCNSSSDSRSTSPSPASATPSIQIEKTDELIATLKSQKTINDQLMVIYERYEPLLDRSDSLTGPDTNQDGIRDDIEAFIDALEVTEPVRNVLKQKARYSQEAISHDFESATDENERLSYKISEKYNKVLACYDYLKVSVEDSTQISRTVRALTYNTKARTLAYLAYNRLLNGTGSTLLSPEEKYCE
ncbi:chromosome partitioning protein ParA [Vibrio vulnificus]|uniref:chromosome partitioning protein ParA n=1 Tax=Vibrio vulnificus TaxID=672 RepID=UPI000927319C|nr:chromosome partitioning protein ParA [Vibrio vulnificus]EGQ7965072.1 chromosome partitioning protein ParA [Vibrio vulnificus]EHU9518066.1 chromosome partitioning protein ParA [Vibrio vulnificus]EID4420459.1 chromosome partitioning protein ParA [Vibrio vulnificus]ELV8612219.1 chromosome partitioning protein ParA [Vibrio vulnificus]MCU8136322.1 chromosome partitioning protein ParA [Vibrio vulnificus]